MRPDPKQQALNELRNGECYNKPENGAGNNQTQAFAGNQPQDVRFGCAERHPNTDLLGALLCQVRDDPVKDRSQP